MKTLTIAWSGLMGTLRDREAAFFIFVLPFVVILLVGFTFPANDTIRLAVTNEGSGPLAAHLVDALEQAPGLHVVRYSTEGAIDRAVRRHDEVSGVVIPRDYDTSMRVAVVALPTNSSAVAQRSIVDAVVTRENATVAAARLVAARTGRSLDDALVAARRVAARQPLVTRRSAGSGGVVPGGFDYAVPSQLVLFVFINALGAAFGLIFTRTTGVARRMLSTPTSAATIVTGTILGRLAITVFQAALIMTLASAVFHIHWGDLPAVLVLMLLFCIVSAGAATLLGALLRVPEQAIAIGAPIGIALAMLGGCMWPLDIVSPALRTIGHLTPHAWAMDAFVDIIGRGAGLRGVAGDLLVLCGFAALLLAIGVPRLRHSLTT